MKNLNEESKHFQGQIDHLQGQVIALRQLVLALANLECLPDAFRNEGMTRIAAARNAVMAQPVSEQLIDGIELTEKWLQHATETEQS